MEQRDSGMVLRNMMEQLASQFLLEYAFAVLFRQYHTSLLVEG